MEVSSVNNYEVVIVLGGKNDVAGAKLIVEKLLKNISVDNLSISLLDINTFAYPIANEKVGYFFVVTFQSTGEQICELNRVLRIDRDVLRYLITNSDKNYGARSLKNEKKVKLAENRSAKYKEIQAKSESNASLGAANSQINERSSSFFRPKPQKSEKYYLRNSYRKSGVYVKNENGEVIYEPVAHFVKNNWKSRQQLSSKTEDGLDQTKNSSGLEIKVSESKSDTLEELPVTSAGKVLDSSVSQQTFLAKVDEKSEKSVSEDKPKRLKKDAHAGEDKQVFSKKRGSGNEQDSSKTIKVKPKKISKKASDIKPSAADVGSTDESIKENVAGKTISSVDKKVKSSSSPGSKRKKSTVSSAKSVKSSVIKVSDVKKRSVKSSTVKKAKEDAGTKKKSSKLALSKSSTNKSRTKKSKA